MIESWPSLVGNAKDPAEDNGNQNKHPSEQSEATVLVVERKSGEGPSKK